MVRFRVVLFGLAAAVVVAAGGALIGWRESAEPYERSSRTASPVLAGGGVAVCVAAAAVISAGRGLGQRLSASEKITIDLVCIVIGAAAAAFGLWFGMLMYARVIWGNGFNLS